MAKHMRRLGFEVRGATGDSHEGEVDGDLTVSASVNSRKTSLGLSSAVVFWVDLSVSEKWVRFFSSRLSRNMWRWDRGRGMGAAWEMKILAHWGFSLPPSMKKRKQ
jgi:hypothetical protein